jgi:hypothetical protein
MTEVENHFTVFVRLPFNRGDFIDPPPVGLCLSKHLQRLINIAGRMVECQRNKAVGCNITPERQ